MRGIVLARPGFAIAFDGVQPLNLRRPYQVVASLRLATPHADRGMTTIYRSVCGSTVALLAATLFLVLGAAAGCGDTSDGDSGADGTAGGGGGGGGFGAGEGPCGRGGQENACGGCLALEVELRSFCEFDLEANADAVCPFGEWACDPANPDVPRCIEGDPSDEVCDDIDNDCDTFVDEDFDLNGDVFNCGGCDIVCEATNASVACSIGECVIESCQPGYIDLDGDIENGCEEDCVPDASTSDGCDGRDNDCDGLTDEDYIPVPCGVGVCASTSVCIDGIQ